MDIRDNLIRIACKIVSVRFHAPSVNNGVLNPSFNFTDLTNFTNLHPSISALTDDDDDALATQVEHGRSLSTSICSN